MSFSTYAVVLTGAFSFGIGYFINIESNHAASGGETVESYKCLPKQFSTVVVSWEPLLIHIDNFITPFEVEHLISIASVYLLSLNWHVKSLTCSCVVISNPPLWARQTHTPIIPSAAPTLPFSPTHWTKTQVSLWLSV